QHQIEQDEVGFVGRQLSDGSGAGSGHLRLVPRLFEIVDEQARQILLILDNQNSSHDSRHPTSSRAGYHRGSHPIARRFRKHPPMHPVLEAPSLHGVQAMKGTLIAMLIGFSLGLTASAQQSTADQRGKGGASAGSERETGTPQLGHSDDRAAASLETHHDLAKNEVTGKVVRVDPGTVWIDHMGAVIPLKIDANTRFESAGIARPKDL